MTKKSIRDACAKTLVEIGKNNKDIIVLEADLQESTQSVQFAKAYSDRFFNIGVAEQNMVGISAGLALGGKIPIAHSFACFISMRACEQVRTTIAYPNLNVKFIVSHGGISCGTAGTTHHAIEDIAIMRSIPNMTVFVPGDDAETRQVVKEAIDHVGPVYIRLGASDVEDVYTPKDKFSRGKATMLRDGKDATIITTGIVSFEGITAADILKKDYGINTRVLQMASIKPLDSQAIKKAALETGKIVTVEEHNILGGLGGAVCEIVAEVGKSQVSRIGINDRFSDVGTATCLMEDEGLTIEGIVRRVRDMVEI
jgi:transketolase